MTGAQTDRHTDWQRLSPRMLFVHPVHELLRQLPVLIGSVVLGTATGNSAWPLAALGLTIGVGLLRWFFTTYRIDDDNVELRTGVLQRRQLSVPRNRIRSVQTDARLLHRLLRLTVLRVGTGQQAHGETAFVLDAVEAERVPQLRAMLLAESLAPAQTEEATGRVLARWRPSWLRYAPLSFSGLVMIGAVLGLAYQTGLALRLQESDLARAGIRAAERPGAVVVVTVGGGALGDGRGSPPSLRTTATIAPASVPKGNSARRIPSPSTRYTVAVWFIAYRSGSPQYPRNMEGHPGRRASSPWAPGSVTG